MTDTANLEDGFYWVRYDWRWEVAEKIGESWYRTCSESASQYKDFGKIDPRPIKREDVK